MGEMQFLVVIAFSVLVAIALKNRDARPVVRFRRLLFDRILPAGLWIVFARSNISMLGNALADDADWLTVAQLASSTVFGLLVTVLFILRRPTSGARSKPRDAAVAIAGTFSLAFIASRPPVHQAPEILATGTTIALFGLLWSIVSLAVLGRCFGVFPEARGLVTHGPYRLVRHPLYLGEIVMGLGILLPVLSPLTAVLWLGSTGLQLWRALNEERVLGSVFPEYAAYRARTHRLIPLLW